MTSIPEVDMKTKNSGSGEITKEIALRAYYIWENEGRPEGREHDHWARAEAEILSEPPPNKAEPKKTTAKKPAASKDPGAKKPSTNGTAKAAKPESPGAPLKAAVKTKKVAKTKKPSPEA
jgi:hypothetical protein